MTIRLIGSSSGKTEAATGWRVLMLVPVLAFAAMLSASCSEKKRNANKDVQKQQTSLMDEMDRIAAEEEKKQAEAEKKKAETPEVKPAEPVPDKAPNPAPAPPPAR